MANPLTCLHRIYQSVTSTGLDVFILCVSCGTELTPEFLAGKNYEYDMDNNVWVYVPKSRESKKNDS